MNSEQLSSLLKQRPFRPFRIHMQGGAFYDVRSHEMALILRNAVLVGVGVSDDEPDPIPDHHEWLYLPHVDSLEELPLELALPRR
ncbi:MAG: hypothetical protein ACJ8FY_06630 [Gemmataceae bacterium]